MQVADFGLSRVKSVHQRDKVVKGTGTIAWMAPELLRGGNNTPESDVYSFGVILNEVFSREDPYKGEDLRMVVLEVMDLQREEEKRPAIDAQCPADVKGLIRDCWSKEAELRPSLAEIDRRLRAVDTAAATDSCAAKLACERWRKTRTGRGREGEDREREECERKASDLIYDVFPEHIAHALRDGKKIEPEKKDMVSIYFSDIVGFTDICSKMDVEKVSDMLDRLYTALDGLACSLNIFKIETIGDAYMCVCNLVEEQPDHAARLAYFAIKAVEVAATTLVDKENESLGSVKLRIGINSGPVVANVIGTSRPKYTLF
eukprot:761139-Hanusia_phi.AAC.1